MANIRLCLWSLGIALLLIWLLRKLIRYFEKFKDIPRTDSSSLIFGDAFEFFQSFLGATDEPLYKVFHRISNEFLDMYRSRKMIAYWLSWYPVVILLDRKYVKRVLNSPDALDKAMEYEHLHDWIGTGLLTSSTTKWRSRRKMLTPAFHFTILNDFVTIFNEHSQVLIDKLRPLCHTPIDLSQHIPYASLDIICETAMGVRIDSQSNPKSAYVQAVRSESELTFRRFFAPFLPKCLYRIFPSGRQSIRNLKTLHSFTRQIINDKIEQRSRDSTVSSISSDAIRPFVSTNSTDSNMYFTSKSKRLTFMDVLIDHHLRSDQFAADQRLSIEDIGEEVDTFMFEGFDTTAAAICWTVFLIGNYSHVQSRLYDELQSLPYHSTYDMVTLNQLKYTEACVKEALRLYPSVPLIARRLSKPIRLDDGRQLPDNVTILIYLPGIHQDPVIFPNPTQFEPERFLVNSPDTFSYLPFSAGHRNCIGQKFAMLEVKSMVAHLFRHYHIESLVPIDQIDYAFELVTRPKCPLSVMLIPRSK